MAVRICKRWCAAHFFTLSEEIIELLVAYVFLTPEPYPIPNNATVAFHRFLNLIITHNWTKTPLVIDLLNEITNEQYTKIDSDMEKWRKENMSKKVMYIVTTQDFKIGDVHRRNTHQKGIASFN
eukprot:UN06049